MARSFLELGVNAGKPKLAGKMTPLMYACAKGYVELVRIILSKGVDPDAEGHETAASCAARGGHRDCLRELAFGNANLAKRCGELTPAEAATEHLKCFRTELSKPVIGVVVGGVGVHDTILSSSLW